MDIYSLDELILRQYDKFSVWSQRKYNCSKYNLVQTCDNITSLGLSAAGTYMVIFGLNTGSAYNLFNGGIYAAAGAIYYEYSKKRNKRLEESELAQIINSEAQIAPSLKIGRLLWLVMGVFGASFGLSSLIYGADLPAEFFNISPVDYNKLIGLRQLSVGIYSLGFASSKYFLDTTIFPPKTKKSPWYQRIYESLTVRIKLAWNKLEAFHMCSSPGFARWKYTIRSYSQKLLLSYS